MTFTRSSADCTKINDTVFKIAKLAKEDIEKNGNDHVVNATIGSLYDEDGKLVALKSVYEHYDKLPDSTKAAYASGFTGNEAFRQEVWNWLLQGRKLNLAHRIIATPGGSGAVSSTFFNILEANQSVVIPDIAWSAYKLMADYYNLKTVTYSLFEDNHFNLKAFKEACLSTLEKQERLLVVINDPCHNPTGYSMSIQEWEEVIAFLNECSKKAPCILLNDIAYIDYGFNTEHTRDYLSCFSELEENVLTVVAFSCSKTCTAYGLRCGAAVLIGKDEKKLNETESVFEKTARAIWSNVANAPMENFSWLVKENQEAFLKEKQFYIQLLEKRSSLFIEEAKQCQLPLYPYKEGFFVTIKVNDDQLKKKFHQALMEQHIYTVEVNHGIRIALCSLSIEKIKGLAFKIKKVFDQCL